MGVGQRPEGLGGVRCREGGHVVKHFGDDGSGVDGQRHGAGVAGVDACGGGCLVDDAGGGDPAFGVEVVDGPRGDVRVRGEILDGVRYRLDQASVRVDAEHDLVGRDEVADDTDVGVAEPDEGERVVGGGEHGPAHVGDHGPAEGELEVTDGVDADGQVTVRARRVVHFLVGETGERVARDERLTVAGRGEPDESALVDVLARGDGDRAKFLIGEVGDFCVCAECHHRNPFLCEPPILGRLNVSRFSADPAERDSAARRAARRGLCP